MIRKNDNLKFTIRNRTREGASSRRRSSIGSAASFFSVVRTNKSPKGKC
jgi:hypothetical protein